jgi:hypothetical protein
MMWHHYPINIIGATTLSLMTLSITTFKVTISNNDTLGINDT